MEFNTLYQELTYSTEMIRVLWTGVSQEEAQSKPTPETWSILEVTCHLRDEEQADFRARLDSILHRPEEEFAVINPQRWVTERKYNEQDFKQAQDVFFADRAKSLEWLKGLDSVNWGLTHTDQY